MGILRQLSKAVTDLGLRINVAGLSPYRLKGTAILAE